MKNNSKIDFYRTNAVHSVLKRYEFNENEKQIIQDAILSAKRNTPNMKTIVKADALLRMVSSSREPIKEVEDSEESVRNRIKVESKYSHAMAKFKYDWNVKPVLLVAAGMFFIVILAVQFTKSQQADWHIEDHGEHTYIEAREICKKHREILPTVSQMNQVYEQSIIYTRIPQYFANKSYWIDAGSKPMIYRIRDDEAIEATPDNLYGVRCLDSANSVLY